MSAPQEWAAVANQPEASRAAVEALLEELVQKGKECVTVVAVGKASVGKSAALNSLAGEKLFPTNAFQPPQPAPREAERQWRGVCVQLIDTPALIDAGTVSQPAIHAILQQLEGRHVDVLLYVDRLDAYRVDTIDTNVAAAISDAFGHQVWQRAVLVLTRAQLTPPDGRSFSDFAAARSDALCHLIRQQGRLGRSHQVPVALVENMEARCRVNEAGEKILPDGAVWYPRLLAAVVAAAGSTHAAVHVDARMAAGPNPNRSGKLLIPLLLLFQVVCVALPLRRAIEADKREERRQRARWEEEAEEYRRSPAAAVARRRIAAFQQQQAATAAAGAGKR